MTKLVFWADNDVTSDAKKVNQAVLTENADFYYHVGDGPYSEQGTEWTDMMNESFGDKKDKFDISRGNHDCKASESEQTQKDIEEWHPAVKSTAAKKGVFPP